MARILIVEDEENLRLLYEEEFRSDGYAVFSVSDGKEAVKRVQEGLEVDVVILDIAMPGMDGLEAMSRMLSKDHKLPVILNTAYAVYKENFRAWSADAYVIKSSDLTELKEAVKRVLESKK